MRTRRRTNLRMNAPKAGRAWLGLLALAFALHETKVAASTYIETVRDACSAPGERKSALALQGTRDQVEALKAIVETKPVTGR